MSTPPIRVRQTLLFVGLLTVFAAIGGTSLIAVRKGEAGAAPLTFTVDTTSADEGGGGPVLTGCTAAANDCSLRGAIVRANANVADGPNTINFSIDTGPKTITLTKALTAITGPVIVNGLTQPGPLNLNCFTQTIGHVPCIKINLGGKDGLVIQGGGSTISGLAIYNGGVAIFLQSSNNVVNNNYLGTQDGTTAGGGATFGVGIVESAENNVIGSTGPRPRNVISSNSIGVYDQGTGTVIKGNFVGTNAAGSASLGNETGIMVESSGAVVGSAGVDANIISGNTGIGVDLFLASDAQVAGNFIGLGADGSTTIGNLVGFWALHTTNSTIGSPDPALRNVISGNASNGLRLYASSGMQLLNNYIGTDATGMSPRPNLDDAVLIESSSNNVIGAPGMGNVIGGRDDDARAVYVVGVDAPANDNLVQSNFIGVNAAGTGALPGAAGVEINAVDFPATGNLVGGAGAGQGNVISAGMALGDVRIAGPLATHNTVAGNILGLAADGSTPITPGGLGAFFDGSPDNTLGGPTAASRNIISNNAYAVLINDSDRAVVQNNYIGTDVTGQLPRGGDTEGLWINFSDDVLVKDNLISANPRGVRLFRTEGVVLHGNSIGLAADGSPLGNTENGVEIEQGEPGGQTIGGSGANANVIAYNGGDGVHVFDDTVNVHITHNSIHDNALLGIALGATGNNHQAAPVLTLAESNSPTHVTGTVAGVPNKQYQLEFFSNEECDPSGAGEGKIFIGSAALNANGAGTVDIDVSNLTVTSVGSVVTATATDENGNTSEFSNCETVVEAPPTPTPSITPTPTPIGQTPTPTPAPTPTASPSGLTQGDNDCDGDSDAVDALVSLQKSAGIDPNQQPGCPNLGVAVPVGVVPAGDAPPLFGDIDCDGDVDAVDALQILRNVAGLPVNQGAGCPAIGDPL